MKIRMFCAAVALAAGTASSALADTTVELWSFLDPDGEGHRSETLAHTLRTFEENNPGISVKTTIMQWSELGPALLRADKVGRTPDLVMIYSPLMPAQIAGKTLAPLNDRVDDLSTTVKEDLILLSVAQDKKGQVFGVPWELRSFGLFYRKDLLEAAGHEVPKTLGELGTIAAEISDATGRVGIAASFNPSSSHIPLEWFMPTLLSVGVPVLDKEGKANFGDGDTAGVLELVRSWTESGASSADVLLNTNDNAQRLAESGRAVFLMQGTHRTGGLRQKSSEGVWAYTPFPGLGADAPVPATIQGWQLVIPQKSDDKDAAWKLIEHWIGTDIQLYQAKKAGYMPVRPSVVVDPFFDSFEVTHLRAGLEHAKRYPLDFVFPKDTDALNNALGKMLQQVITGSKAGQDAISWAEAEYERTKR